ncbi:unnamed protein product [Hyaloperonospora brassicae]|uniref:FYVE-type domain-containing protein n=1 Tax=Hyaloperonospora brassicae TaxID=162125 RepID=A0AAV0U830_HYABA|nr:unnamed protein product [Hyaloperonospora brassicae]
MDQATSPFVPLVLLPHDAIQLTEVAYVFVQRHVEAYDRHLHQDCELIDKKQWRPIQQRGDVQVFLAVQSCKRSESAKESGVRKQQQYTNSAALPELLTVGHVGGSLDDVMLGAMTPTIASMRLKHFYAGIELNECAVLATIDCPSPADPFQSLNIKWAEGYQPPMVRSVARDRDFVYMEATGFAKLRDGEEVGYHLLHSVHFPQTPKVGRNVRGTISMCELYRQRNHSTVDLYARALMDFGGRLGRSYAVKCASTALLSVRHVVRCAHLKKLAWLLRLSDPTVVFQGELKCIDCRRRPGLFVTDIGSCALCKRALCMSCRLKIELGFVGLTGCLAKRKLWFCKYCWDEAAQTSSRVAAIEEYADTRSIEQSGWSSDSPSNSALSNAGRGDVWSFLG